MAVIKNTNKGVYKRKLEKRVDFSILENQFNQWYSSTPDFSRGFGWPQEEGQLRELFEGKLNEDGVNYRNKVDNERKEFGEKYNGKQAPPGVIEKHESMLAQWQKEFEDQQRTDRLKYTSLIHEYSLKVVNPQPTSSNSPTPTSVPPPETPGIVPLPTTPPPPSATTLIDPIIAPTPSVSERKDPTSTNVGRSKGGRGNNGTHEEYNPEPVDNNNVTNFIIKMPTYAKIPFLCIIIIAIVAVVCAAIFVMRRRKKTRQYNAEFGFKTNNFDSNEFDVVTGNTRIITESIINEYANEYTQSEVQDYTNDNNDNQIENVETASANDIVAAPTNDVVSTEEYTNNQENYAFTQQYNEAYTTRVPNNFYPEGTIQVEEPIDEQPISQYPSSLDGKELSIDDFIPLIQGR